MKKIGILTFWNIPNYGTFMQAYALQKVLSLIYKECEVKQIPYLNKKHYKMYFSNINMQYSHWYINPRFYKELLNIKSRMIHIKNRKKFISYYSVIPHFDKNLNINDLELDYLFLGSDIIWDYQIVFFGKDKYLFGLNIPAKKKISYAPSFGTVITGKEAPEYVRRSLKELTYISVRDKKSKNLVKEISDREATIVLDPTLIWDFGLDKNIIKPILGEKYVIVYGSFFTKELIFGAQNYCKENNLKLICLSSLDDKFDWCDLIIKQDDLNPFEWAGYFKHASAVMTCTYHGLMFGLIFMKKIIFNPTDFIMHKANSLIDNLGLNEVLVNFTDFESKIRWSWDYTEINKRLETIRMDSFKFLEGVINNDS